MIVVEHGAVPVDDLYFELKAGSTTAAKSTTPRSSPGGRRP